MSKLLFLGKKLTFIFQDVKEISTSAYGAFVETFHYKESDSDSDSGSDLVDSSDSSDLSDFDSDSFGCGEITPAIEEMVENTWEICHPLDEVYDGTTSSLIKQTMSSATEETQCAGLNFFKDIAQGKDRSLITTCTTVAYWCCCETVKKVSPIIAKATLNLLDDL